MDYFERQESSCKYFFAIKEHAWPECADALTVVEYPAHHEYSIRFTTFIPGNTDRITKEEFEAAYDNAINSFMPFLESISQS